MIEKGLSKEEMDFVTEALSIGAGNAATALSQMLGCGVDLPVPKVCFLSPEEVPSIIEDRSLQAIVAKIGFVGDMKGEIFYIVKEGDVRELVHLIKKTFPVDEKAGIAEISVMEETANIITGVYLSAISNFCGLNISHTIPVASSVTLQALTDEIKAKGYQLKGMQLIAIINEFTVAERRIVTYLLLALSEEALKILSLKIAEALRKMEIKGLEEKVVQRTLEFHTVVETAGDAIISMKPPGEIYLWNKKAEEMFGYLAEEVIGKDLHSLIVPERYREKAGEGYRAFFQTGTGPIVGKTIEIEAIRKDGTEFPVELTVSAMNIRGEWHATGIVRDIIERKKAEEALRESEERFRLIAETITEVFWMADIEINKIFYINPAYERIWGRLRQSLYENPRSFIESIHENDRARVLADFELEKTGQPFDHEYRIIQPDGTLRWIWDRGFPIHEPTGEARRYVGIAQDITERKKAEESLHKSEEAFRMLFESSRDAIMTLTADEGFLRGNPATVALFGCRDEQEFIALSPALTSPEFQPDGRRSDEKAQEMMRLAMDKGSHFFEWGHKRVDETEFIADVLLTRMEIGGKKLLQATVRDITERKKAENELKDRLDELERFHRVTVDREIRMHEVMDENERLKKKVEEMKKS